MTQENLSLGFPTRSDTNQTVQPQKMARVLKFWILKEEGLYFLCSENKGADQLCGNARLRSAPLFFANFFMTRLICFYDHL